MRLVPQFSFGRSLLMLKGIIGTAHSVGLKAARKTGHYIQGRAFTTKILDLVRHERIYDTRLILDE